MATEVAITTRTTKLPRSPIGTLGGRTVSFVDGRGTLYFAGDTVERSIGWSVRPGDKWRALGSEAATRQHWIGGGAIPETELTWNGGGVKVHTYAIAAAIGSTCDAWIISEATNQGDDPIAVAIDVSDPGIDVAFERPPSAESVAERANTWPLIRGASIRIAVPLGGLAGPVTFPAGAPGLADAVSGWETHATHAAQATLPDLASTATFERALAALRTVELSVWLSACTPLDQMLALAALAACGVRLNDPEDLLRILGEDMDDSPEEAMAWLDLFARAAMVNSWTELPETIAMRLARTLRVVGEATGALRPGLLPRLLGRSTHEEATFHDGSGWALLALAAVLDRMDQPDAATVARASAELISPSDLPPADLLLQEAHHVDAADGFGEPGTFDAAAAAKICRLMADVVWSVDTDSVITAYPSPPDRWLGQGVEAYRFPTHDGALSAAIRFHGTRPALLWERADTTDVASALRCGFDPAWSSTTGSGDALLAEPAGVRGEVPTEGESFS